jgi:cystathionine gamma-synthase
MIPSKHHHNSTISVHAGEHKNRPDIHDSITTPLVLTSTYWFKDTQQVVDFNEGRYNSHEYGRYGNPTVRVLEQKLRDLESLEKSHEMDCLFSSSGMASVCMMLLSLLEPGSHLVITNDCYRRTRQFISEFFSKRGVTFSVIDPSDLKSLEDVVSTKKAALYFSETPTNPYLRCVDITRVVEICHAHKCLVSIDTTFATPVLLRPLQFGADLVLHSGTKFLAGHNDVLSGAIVGKSEIIATIKKMQNILGPVLDPHGAYLIIRGLKTLSLRVLHSSRTALELAKRLEKHDLVTQVYYPGLPSHPDHQVAKKYFENGYGGVLSFEIRGDFNTSAHFIDSLRIPYIAPSLGGAETLAELPSCMSYWNLSQSERLKFGIKDNLVRFSCGIEDTEDIIEDVMQALEKLRGNITTKIFSTKSAL